MEPYFFEDGTQFNEAKPEPMPVTKDEQARITELLNALRAAHDVINELMTEFVSKKRAANWETVNDGLVLVDRALSSVARSIKN